MPRSEDFDSNVEAQLVYASTLSPDETLSILRRRFDDGSWRSLPGEWFYQLCRVAHAHHLAEEPRVTRLRGSLVATLVDGGIGREAHETLLELFRNLVIPVTREEAGRLVKWFLARAEPGDASVAADVLEHVWKSKKHALSDETIPLGEWLLANGAAELRARRRAVLLLHLVRVFDRPDIDSNLVAAVARYIIVNDENLGRRHEFVNHPHDSLCAIEHLVERGGSGALVAELAAKMGPAFIDNVLEPLNDQPTYPLIRAALVRSLACGTGPLSSQLWKSALYGPCPEFVEFGSSTSVLAALDALGLHVSLPERRDGSDRPGDPADDRAWARLIMKECARIFDLEKDVPKVLREKLIRCVGLPGPVAEGIGESLRDAVRDTDGLAGEILAENQGHRSIAAAIAALPQSSVVATENESDVSSEDLRRLFTKIVDTQWVAPIFGVDLRSVFGDANRIEFDSQGSGEQIIIDGGIVKVKLPPIHEMLGRVSFHHEAKLAFAALYFIHEAVHLAQGIRDKSLVSALRSTGAETTLLHVDLGADHLAALAVERVFPEWNLPSLKDLQGKSLMAFPVSPYNTAAGRTRKAQRLVSLRLDYLARATPTAGGATIGDGYVFADYGPVGGSLLALVSGPPMRVIAAMKLSVSEAEVLASAADDGLDAERIARVDVILEQKVREPLSKIP